MTSPQSNWNNMGVWQDGDLLVVAGDGVLPDICVICSSANDVVLMKQKIRGNYSLGFLLFGFLHQNWVLLKFGLCQDHIKSRKKNILISIALFPLSLLMIFCGFFLPVGFNLIPLLAGALLSLFSMFLFKKSQNVLKLFRLRKKVAWIKGVHRDLLSNLPSYERLKI